MTKTNKQIHVALFPWFAYGHLIPFLHLSNKLAERGHKISFFLPKSAQPKLAKLSHYPNLIHFFPLTIPQLQGLPPGAETSSDMPYLLNGLLCTAFDKTRDQVEHLLATLMPQIVLFDLAYWVPSLAKKLNIKTAYYSVVSAAITAFGLTPRTDMTPENPSHTLKLEANELAEGEANNSVYSGGGLDLYQRLTTSLRDCDAIAMRTCVEIEGRFCDYIAKVYRKSVFVTGTVLPHTTQAAVEVQNPQQEVEEKWTKWLAKFERGSLVYCAFGSQISLQKDRFQELLLGFELSRRPFLAALSPPEGCKTVEEAFPEGFEERVGERGWVYGGWAPQTVILEHPSVGCFVSHCGFGSMWESLLSDSQIVLVPFLFDQIINARLLGDELKVAVEAERLGENRWISKESLSKAIEKVMDKSSEVASQIKTNHANLKNILSRKGLQEEYVDAFVQNLQDLIQNN